MPRLLAIIGMLLAGVMSASAQSGPVATKFRFDIHEPGSFGTKTLKELGTRQAEDIVTAACAAFGVNCSTEADAGAAAIKTMVVGDKPQGEAHNGIIRAPVGYEICQAKVDTAHASVDGQSSFSGEIIRDPSDNGLGFYAEVPQFRPEGHSVEADLYFLFVPAGTLGQYGCWPASNHSEQAHLWDWHNGTLVWIQPQARYQ